MNLFNALMRLGSLTTVSHILGFMRDMIIARVFGAGDAADAFLTAFKLPSLLWRILAEGVLPQALAPALAEYRRTKSPGATRESVQYMVGMPTSALTIATVVDVLAAPWTIRATATGFSKDPGKLALATGLLRIVFPYILLISLSSFVSSILNTYHKFQIPAFTPVLLNVSFIMAALLLMPYFNPPAAVLTWAVFIGGVLQLVSQLPWLAKQGFLKLPKPDSRSSAVSRIIKLMIPSIFVANVAWVLLVISTILASYLQSSSVT